MNCEENLKNEFKSLKIEALIVLLFTKINEKKLQLHYLQEEIKILQTCYSILKENEAKDPKIYNLTAGNPCPAGSETVAEDRARASSSLSNASRVLVD